MDNVRCYQLGLPGRIKAFTVLKDGYYTIVINSALSLEQQLKEYEHEMCHIKSGDYESKLPADMIEVYAHNF